MGLRRTTWRCFNPRSSRSRGATAVHGGDMKGRERFQPTLPAFTRSDHVAHVRACGPGFNPRSSRSRRATRGAGVMPIITAKFQPTLLAFTRSDFDAPPPSTGTSYVSTHAPRVHEERPSLPGRRAPLGAGFNPRSSRSRGATLDVRTNFLHRRVSTHAPRVHEERPRDGAAPHNSQRFQPTLLAFTRSDHAVRAHQLQAGVVSTHAPRVHEERPAGLAIASGHEVSTHAPRVHKERP